MFPDRSENLGTTETSPRSFVGVTTFSGKCSGISTFPGPGGAPSQTVDKGALATPSTYATEKKKRQGLTKFGPGDSTDSSAANDFLLIRQERISAGSYVPGGCIRGNEVNRSGRIGVGVRLNPVSKSIMRERTFA
ncbi:UNVERIFIED_CONTAM: hypothetical protein PYX00_009693 [Menopon gallinae]|uniref:Uncharacterized protein n=1 Tax=Menopon gallinae TaxID=328185 RepID=A0AAW2HCS3_9NEOP